jgi:hypothetical protein
MFPYKCRHNQYGLWMHSASMHYRLSCGRNSLQRALNMIVACL